jgi:iron complex transport system permease protein
MASEQGRMAVGREQTVFDRSVLAVAIASTTVVVVAGVVQVSLGTYSMTLAEAWRSVFDLNVLTDPAMWNAFLLGGELPEMSRQTLVVWSIRLPRVLVGILAGMGLAVSGAIFQGVTRNELASPFVLGVSSGAGLAVLIALVVFGGLAAFLPLIAAVGGAVAFLIVYVIAWQGGTSPVRLVLAGIIVGVVFESLQWGLFFFAEDIGVVQAAIEWTRGSLTGTGWEQVRVATVPTLIAVGLAALSSRQLNLLLLGEGTAQSLGMSVERVRFGLSAVGILAAASAIAVAGIVAFVGLIVPHVVRQLVGTDYRRLIIGCAFVGPALLVSADVGARLLLAPQQIPVGVVTGLIGGPYFLYLMRRQREVGKL